MREGLRRALARTSRPIRRRWRNRGAREWAVGPPDFVGVGAQRCGTTWWWRLLCAHPRIHPGEGKEMHFFDGYFDGDFSDADVHAYHRLFARPSGSLIGEWSPRYMHDFWTPALLRRAAPEARILVMLRDPLRRYQSGLSHEADVLKRSVRGRRRGYVGAMSASNALSRSLYGRQLRAVLEHFERAHVLILQYERCLEDPTGELQRTYAFLGAHPGDYQLPPSLIDRRGSSHPQLEPTDAVAEAARGAILRDAAELKALAPEIDFDLWPSCHGLESGSER